jgi:glycosyltransferase involved in cell wall biosynthesis
VGPGWIVTQIGSREHYAVPRAFARQGKLAAFFTEAWFGTGRSLIRRGPGALRALAGRYHSEIPCEKVFAFTWQSLVDRFKQPKNPTVEQAHLEYMRVGKWFCESVNRRLRGFDLSPEKHSFYGYNTGCFETLQMLRQRGILCVVNQIDPARVEEELVLEEVALWPGWEKVEGRKPEVYWNRLEMEWELSDVVVVNSEWSKLALERQGVRSEKIAVIPLAYEAEGEPAWAKQPQNKPAGPLHVLWLGSVILRKGIQYLVEAAKLLASKDVRITVAGPILISAQAVKSAPGNMSFIGRVSRDQAAGLYREADLFVLPTVSDGFAITQLEAMSYGLPVITTPNCGKVVSDGVDGRIVPVRDPAALASAIAEYGGDRQKLADASSAAILKSKQFSLGHLADRLGELSSRRVVGSAV